MIQRVEPSRLIATSPTTQTINRGLPRSMDTRTVAGDESEALDPIRSS